MGDFPPPPSFQKIPTLLYTDKVVTFLNGKSKRLLPKEGVLLEN